MVFQPSSFVPAPLAKESRIVSLDVLRGVAILGILFINVVGFGIATGEKFSTAVFSDLLSADFFSYAAVYMFFEGKMRAMFCMLFGAGILLFGINKKNIQSRRVTLLFYLRMLWLVLFGVVNAHLLLWNGDILFFYGLFGMLVFLLRKIKPIYMIMAIPFVTIVWFVVGTFYYRDVREKLLAFKEAEAVQLAGKTLSAKQQQAITEWETVKQSMFPGNEEVQASVEKMRGDYSTVASEVRPKALKAQTSYLPVELGDNVALMLLGMALFQWGFFSGKWTKRQYRLTMFVGYAVTIPITMYELWYAAQYTTSVTVMQQQIEQTAIPWKSLLYPVQRIFMAMAHCALLIMLVKSGYLTALCKRLQAVGQMALSNYILQTILCSFFFYGYGLGFYNRLQLHEVYYFVAFAVVLQLLWSSFWLKYFKFGPLEWLWRSLTYKWQSISIRKPVTAKLFPARVMSK